MKKKCMLRLVGPFLDEMEYECDSIKSAKAEGLHSPYIYFEIIVGGEIVYRHCCMREGY